VSWEARTHDAAGQVAPHHVRSDNWSTWLGEGGWCVIAPDSSTVLCEDGSNAPWGEEPWSPPLAFETAAEAMAFIDERHPLTAG
jgi:hypothetical protein